MALCKVPLHIIEGSSSKPHERVRDSAQGRRGVDLVSIWPVCLPFCRAGLLGTSRGTCLRLSLCTAGKYLVDISWRVAEGLRLCLLQEEEELGEGEEDWGKDVSFLPPEATWRALF